MAREIKPVWAKLIETIGIEAIAHMTLSDVSTVRRWTYGDTEPSLAVRKLVNDLCEANGLEKVFT